MVGDGHFGVGRDEPTRQASGGSAADRQSEVCSPSSPAEDSSCKLYGAKQRVVPAEAVITRAVEQKAIYEGEVAEGEKRLQQLLSEDASPAPPAPACPPQVAELQRQIDDLMKEREMWKVAKKQGFGAQMDLHL